MYFLAMSCSLFVNILLYSGAN